MARYARRDLIDLDEALSDRARHITGGHTSTVLCPRCHGVGTEDDDKAHWDCGMCGASGIVTACCGDAISTAVPYGKAPICRICGTRIF